MGSRLAVLLLAMAAVCPAQTGQWLQGRWLFYPAHLITDSNARDGEVRNDSDGTLYHLSPFKAYAGGRWDSLPGRPGSSKELLIRNRSDYWIADSGSLSHHKDGQVRRFDSANSCLRGDQLRLVAFDKRGRPLIGRVNARNRASPLSLGTVRFSESGCDTVPLPIQNPPPSLVLVGYFADSLGREYFSFADDGDSPGPGMFMRVDGTRIDTLGPSYGARGFVRFAKEWMGAGEGGLYHVQKSGRLHHYTAFGGRLVETGVRLHVDALGILWVAVRDERILAFHPSSTPWSQDDAPLFTPQNAGFPDGAPQSLAEDAAGNLWVGFSGGQYAIFARDTAGLAVRPPGPGRGSPSGSPRRSPVNALGRRVGSPRNSDATPKPRRILFPAPRNP